MGLAHPPLSPVGLELWRWIECSAPQPNPADDYVDLPTVTLGQDLPEELSCLSACTSAVGILYKDRRVIFRSTS
jgi:hypothetical protein